MVSDSSVIGAARPRGAIFAGRVIARRQRGGNQAAGGSR
jgi:hypothetical protein